MELLFSSAELDGVYKSEGWQFYLDRKSRVWQHKLAISSRWLRVLSSKNWINNTEQQNQQPYASLG